MENIPKVQRYRIGKNNPAVLGNKKKKVISLNYIF